MRSILFSLMLFPLAVLAEAPRLLFWTGFEGGIGLQAPRRGECWHNGCWQDVAGTDPETGFSWPPRIWGGTVRYQMLSNPVGGGANERNVGEYIVNEVQTVEGPKGQRTRAMYSAILKGGGDATQNPLMLLPDTELPTLYISQWIRLQPDLVHKLRGTWRDIFEFKTTDTDYRLELAIVSWGGGPPVWQARGDGWIPRYTEYWRIQNKTVPVPIGEWFKLEVYWKRSAGRDGRAWFAVNGKVIADRSGPNIGPRGSRINRVMVNQLYASSGAYPIYQWVDDLQIWSDFPAAKPGDPWYDPPYASRAHPGEEVASRRPPTSEVRTNSAP